MRSCCVAAVARHCVSAVPYPRLEPIFGPAAVAQPSHPRAAGAVGLLERSAGCVVVPLSVPPRRRPQMDEFKAQHWRLYMIGVQLRTRDGHATSGDITSLCFRCALLLTDALPRAWKQNSEVGWFLATDDPGQSAVGQRMLEDFAAAASVPVPQLVYAECPKAAVNVSEAVASMRCAVMHMALLGEVDDVLGSKASTFGDIGHVLSGLVPMPLTEHLTCTRQPVADPCFHHWHYVRTEVLRAEQDTRRVRGGHQRQVCRRR